MLLFGFGSNILQLGCLLALLDLNELRDQTIVWSDCSSAEDQDDGILCLCKNGNLNTASCLYSEIAVENCQAPIPTTTTTIASTVFDVQPDLAMFDMTYKDERPSSTSETSAPTATTTSLPAPAPPTTTTTTTTAKPIFTTVRSEILPNQTFGDGGSEANVVVAPSIDQNKALSETLRDAIASREDAETSLIMQSGSDSIVPAPPGSTAQLREFARDPVNPIDRDEADDVVGATHNRKHNHNSNTINTIEDLIRKAAQEELKKVQIFSVSSTTTTTTTSTTTITTQTSVKRCSYPKRICPTPPSWWYKVVTVPEEPIPWWIANVTAAPPPSDPRVSNESIETDLQQQHQQQQQQQQNPTINQLVLNEKVHYIFKRIGLSID